jgi:hypothetical protein
MKRVPFFLLILASCGGNVVVDGPSGTGGHGGHGGTTTTGINTTGTNTTGTSIDVSSSSSFMTSTSVTAVTSTGTMPASCGSLHVASNPSCQLCVEAMCCSRLLACDQGTACGQLLQCVVNCPMMDMVCTNDCANMFQSGVQALNDLGNCIGHCPPGECNQAPTSVCDSGLVANTNTCDECLTIECCAEAEACAGNGVCEKCLSADQGPQCAPVYAKLGACKASRCPKACP